MTEDETIVPAGGNNEPNETAPTPQAAPVQPAAFVVPEQPAPQSTAQAAKDDLTKLLQDVKLPERRDFKGIADTPKKVTPNPIASILEEHIIGSASDRDQQAQQSPATIPKDKKANEGRSSSLVVPIRTLKDDLQSIIRSQKISLVHAVSLEEEKKHGQEHLTPEQQEIKKRGSRRAIGILFTSAIFVLLGVGALAGVFFVVQEQRSVSTPPQSSILFAEQTETLSLDNQQPTNLKDLLARARVTPLGSLGSITRVVPTILSTTTGTSVETAATLSQFFNAIGVNPPQELMSAIGPGFFFGFHVVDTNAPLLVIPVTSYDHAFAGMLAWEPTMDSDLSPIFTSVSMTVVATSGVPVARTFSDSVMRNYDIRELTDDAGNVVLYYSFPTPNILVIAQSPYSFSEILSRLQAAREL